MPARKLVASLLILQLVACASVRTAPPEDDAQRKSFAARPDVASLYIYSDEYWGAFHFANVSVDDAPLGQLGTHSYLHVELTPGRHTVTAQSGNTDTIEFDAAADSVAFIALRKRFGGVLPNVTLAMAADAEGRKGVEGGKLATSTFAAEDLAKAKAAVVGVGVLTLLPMVLIAVVVPQVGAAAVLGAGMR